MCNRKCLWLLIGIIATSLLAASSTFKTFSTQEQLEKGKAQGVAIDALGQLKLAPAAQEIFRASVPAIWSAASDKQGSFYLGAGNPALVLRLGNNLKADTVFAGNEVAVTAMAFANGALYFATSPDGQIYKYSSGSKAQLFHKPQAKYVWALEPGKGGALFVATGEPGRILRLSPTGEAEAFFETEETHLRSLLWDSRADVLYAGSSGNGYVYRLTADKKVTVLYDAPSAEIHSLALHTSGDLYLAGAAASGAALFLPTAPTPGATPAATIVASEEDEENAIVITAGGEPALGAPEAMSAGATLGEGGLGAIYRISPSGIAKTIWSSRAERVHAMLLTSVFATKDEAFHVLVGTGDKGKVFLLNEDGSRTLLLESEAGQITSFTPEGKDQIKLTTANPGTAQLLRQAMREQGEYVSEVIDASAPAQWGGVSWQTNAAAGVSVLTRSGNTGKPDKTWSDWVAVQGAGAIASPVARFLQWKVVLQGKAGQSPAVKDVRVSYLQANIAPEITQIRIYEPGEAFPDARQNSNDHAAESDGAGSSVTASPAPSAGRKVTQKGARSIGWKTRDDNKDPLEFHVEIRAWGETAWRELIKKYRGSVYTFDSQALPDGEYQVRITVSDRLGNPPELAKIAQKTSEVFTIDNSPPEIGALAVKLENAKHVASFQANDRLSRISEAWYCLDAGEWQLAYPVDHVSDQKSESYRITLPEGAGGKVLAVKVSDANGNIGFGKVTVAK
ncbi:hypothetical protein DCC62_15825 [candidate division KSB1 bacterium]|nr:MAG: hypothetical protein DCC62_15825 [candidate division KSB1 bacterium]